MCHYPLWCVAVLDSYDDEMMVVCVCHYHSGVLQCWAAPAPVPGPDTGTTDQDSHTGRGHGGS